MVDDTIKSDSPKEFSVDPTRGIANKNQVQIVVQSNKRRTLDDLKNMISFQAVDQKTGQSMLLDGKSIFVPTFKAIKDENNDRNDKIRFEPTSIVVSPQRSMRLLCCFLSYVYKD